MLNKYIFSVYLNLHGVPKSESWWLGRIFWWVILVPQKTVSEALNVSFEKKYLIHSFANVWLCRPLLLCLHSNSRKDHDQTQRSHLHTKIANGWIEIHTQSLPYIFNGPFPASFSFCLFHQQLTVNCSIKVADDWIRTRVLSLQFKCYLNQFNRLNN